MFFGLVFILLMFSNLLAFSSSVHGILQGRILEWVVIPFSRESSQCRDWTWVSCITGRFFILKAIREVLCIRTKHKYFYPVHDNYETKSFAGLIWLSFLSSMLLVLSILWFYFLSVSWEEGNFWFFHTLKIKAIQIPPFMRDLILETLGGFWLSLFPALYVS